MQPWAQDFKLVVEKPETDKFAPSGGWGKVIAPVSPWATQQQTKPAYADDEQLKKQFGVEWAKCGKPFEAACKVFEKDTSAASWIASYWLADPLVVAAKDVYLKEVKSKSLLLDKDAYAAMLMEKALEGGFEDKEVVNLLKLYGDVRGFTGKNETNINNFNNNDGLKVVFVKADPQPLAVAPTVSNVKSEILNDGPSPIKIKLVGNG